MSEPIASAESTVPAARMPWDWRLLEFAMRHTSLPAKPRPIPRAFRLGLGAGALEGLLLGLIQGKLGGVIFSVVWGALVGFLCGMIVWKVRQHISMVVLSVLAGVLIEALGSWLIIVYIPWLAQIPFWTVAEFFLLIALGIMPFTLLLIGLLYREIRAALGGLIPGAYVGVVCSTIFCVFLATTFNVWWAHPLGGLYGAFLGLMAGPLIGAFLGILVGALVNVNRRTILPTYFGFASAIPLGVTGWFIGGDLAGVGGDLFGVMFGCSWGAIAGIAFGTLLTPRSWRTLSFRNLTDHINPTVFDMSNGRRLADLADTPCRKMLVMLILGQIVFRTRRLCLEPLGEEYRVAFDDLDSSLDPHPPMLLGTGREIIAVLKELAGLEPAESNDSRRRREGDIQVILSSHRVDLNLIFEPTPRGERVTMTFRHDDSAADAAARVFDRFLFVLKARRCVITGHWPASGGLREIA